MPKWIKFESVLHHNPKAKTKIWRVRNKENDSILGEIKWYGAWRKYAFFANVVADNIIFEQVCLRNIADFVEKATLKHKSGRP